MLVVAVCLAPSVDACVDTWQIKLCDPSLTRVVRERFVVSLTQYKRPVYFISSPVSVLYFDCDDERADDGLIASSSAYDVLV